MKKLLILALLIFSLSDAFSQFRVVVTYGGSISNQRWKRRETFPKDDISKDWDDDFYLTSVSYNDGNWSIISSKGIGYTTQAWRTREEFPEKEIDELWEDGYAITDLTYGNGVWALVMSKGTDYNSQSWSTRSEFPKERIKEFWNDDKNILKIAYGQEKWAVVATKTDNIITQKWETSADYPAKQIEEADADGYSITQLEYLNDRWVLILSKYKGYRDQYVVKGDDYPTDGIRGAWDNDFYITGVGYYDSDDDYILGLLDAMDPDTPTTTTTNTTTETRPESTRDPRLYGKWVGKTPGDELESYLTFFDDNRIIFESGDQILGGKDYVMDGIKLDIFYELNTQVRPHQIDIVYEIDGEEKSRLKGIFEFVGKTEMVMALATDADNDRPNSITQISKNGPTPTRFRKTNK